MTPRNDRPLVTPLCATTTTTCRSPTPNPLVTATSTAAPTGKTGVRRSAYRKAGVRTSFLVAAPLSSPRLFPRRRSEVSTQELSTRQFRRGRAGDVGMSNLWSRRGERSRDEWSRQFFPPAGEVEGRRQARGNRPVSHRRTRNSGGKCRLITQMAPPPSRRSTTSIHHAMAPPPSRRSTTSLVDRDRGRGRVVTGLDSSRRPPTTTFPQLPTANSPRQPPTTTIPQLPPRRFPQQIHHDGLSLSAPRRPRPRKVVAHHTAEIVRPPQKRAIY